MNFFRREILLSLFFIFYINAVICSTNHEQLRKFITNLENDKKILKQIDHLKNLLHENKFEEKLRKLEHIKNGTFVVSTMPVNVKKNRFVDPCYDHSRVLLNPEDNFNKSDYIHASWADGYKKKNAYIITQGLINFKTSLDKLLFNWII
jgi:hypothetical protein